MTISAAADTTFIDACNLYKASAVMLSEGYDDYCHRASALFGIHGSLIPVHSGIIPPTVSRISPERSSSSPDRHIGTQALRCG